MDTYRWTVFRNLLNVPARLYLHAPEPDINSLPVAKWIGRVSVLPVSQRRGFTTAALRFFGCISGWYRWKMGSQCLQVEARSPRSSYLRPRNGHREDASSGQPNCPGHPRQRPFSTCNPPFKPGCAAREAKWAPGGGGGNINGVRECKSAESMEKLAGAAIVGPQQAPPCFFFLRAVASTPYLFPPFRRFHSASTSTPRGIFYLLSTRELRRRWSRYRAFFVSFHSPAIFKSPSALDGPRRGSVYAEKLDQGNVGDLE